MEVIYLTDIHDNLKSLRYVIENTSADLYIISGDLVYKAFYSEDKLYHFLELQDEFYRYIAQHELEYLPYELAMKILNTPDFYEEKWRINAGEYRLLFQKAAGNMKEKYQTIKELVEKYSDAPTILIPGNYDMDLQFTSLYSLDLHKKSRVYEGIHFSGYGGAPIMTPGIPEMLSVVFDEENNKGQLKSEPSKFFQKMKPDVLVIHNPAYGTLDRVYSHGNSGSFGIRNYIDENMPSLVLSGHVHEDFGLLKTNKTFCLNPSNFGGVDTPSGYEAGGYFCKFTLLQEKSDEYKKRIFLRHLTLYRNVKDENENRQIKEVLEIQIDKNLRAAEFVLDEEEYKKIGGFLR